MANDENHTHQAGNEAVPLQRNVAVLLHFLHGTPTRRTSGRFEGGIGLGKSSKSMEKWKIALFLLPCLIASLGHLYSLFVCLFVYLPCLFVLFSLGFALPYVAFRPKMDGL